MGNGFPSYQCVCQPGKNAVAKQAGQIMACTLNIPVQPMLTKFLAEPFPTNEQQEVNRIVWQGHRSR